MTPRDDLAALIVQSLIDTVHPTCYIAGNDTDALTVDGQVNLRAVADGILAAGWTPPPARVWTGEQIAEMHRMGHEAWLKAQEYTD
jgi:hypothetical protein